MELNFKIHFSEAPNCYKIRMESQSLHRHLHGSKSSLSKDV